jgi:hypothetical protein
LTKPDTWFFPWISKREFFHVEDAPFDPPVITPSKSRMRSYAVIT